MSHKRHRIRFGIAWAVRRNARRWLGRCQRGWLL